jgi:hypothetical protein
MPVFRPHSELTVVLFFKKEPTKKKYMMGKKETLRCKVTAESASLLSFDCSFSITEKYGEGVTQL